MPSHGGLYLFDWAKSGGPLKRRDGTCGLPRSIIAHLNQEFGNDSLMTLVFARRKRLMMIGVDGPVENVHVERGSGNRRYDLLKRSL